MTSVWWRVLTWESCLGGDNMLGSWLRTEQGCKKENTALKDAGPAADTWLFPLIVVSWLRVPSYRRPPKRAEQGRAVWGLWRSSGRSPTWPWVGPEPCPNLGVSAAAWGNVAKPGLGSLAAPWLPVGAECQPSSPGPHSVSLRSASLTGSRELHQNKKRAFKGGGRERNQTSLQGAQPFLEARYRQTQPCLQPGESWERSQTLSLALPLPRWNVPQGFICALQSWCHHRRGALGARTS